MKSMRLRKIKWSPKTIMIMETKRFFTELYWRERFYGNTVSMMHKFYHMWN